MMTLILGVTDSGKSELAEQLAAECLPGAKKLYIATMIPQDAEGKARVERHRKNREGKDFLTIECPYELSAMRETVKAYAPCVCLLECVSNLAGNEMHRKENEGLSAAELADHIAVEIMDLKTAAAELFVVSNEFDKNAPSYDDETKRYVALNALVNERLRSMAEKQYVYENGGFILHEAV